MIKRDGEIGSIPIREEERERNESDSYDETDKREIREGESERMIGFAIFRF
jgi:hypothetical protein